MFVDIKNQTMQLQDKNAVIFAAGASLGEAVAKAYAGAGANLFLSGRSLNSVQRVADEIVAAGGKAAAFRVDALDPVAVRNFTEMVCQKAGSIDICFNAIGLEDKQGTPLIDMMPEDFVRPIRIAVESHFITDTACGRIMVKQVSGVILSLTATPGGIGYPLVGGFGTACCAIESLSRQLASELGPYGVRVVNMRSGGSPDSRPFKEAIATGGEPVLRIIDRLKDDTMLKKLPLMADIANLAVFLSSDSAALITGVTVDITAGTTSGLNYRMEVIPFE